MPDRLAQFAAQGLIDWRPDAGECELRGPGLTAQAEISGS